MKDISNQYKVHESKIILDGFLRVRQDILELPDSSKMKYLVAEESDCVMVIVRNKIRGTFVLAGEYRHAVKSMVYSFPAGFVDPGETHKEAAIRECVEEINIRPKKLHHLGTFFSDPGISVGKMSFFYCEDFVGVENSLEDPEEFIQIEEVSLEDVARVVESGNCGISFASAFSLARLKKFF